jgi:septum formation protein
MSVLRRLILASRSPRRIELLAQLGLVPTRVLPTDIEESSVPGEDPRELVLRLAEAKGRAALGRLGRGEPPALVLAADTAVVLEHSVLGKPRDAEHAARMLRLLRGRIHEVLTGVFLLRTDDGRSTVGVATTRVRLRDFDEETIRRYVASGEPMDKAGSYGIQGEGSRFVESIEGSWSNVVGLPLEPLREWASRIGVELGELRSGSTG